jgi:hypothetical protein
MFIIQPTDCLVKDKHSSLFVKNMKKSFITLTPDELDFVFPTFEPEMDLSLTTSGVGQVVEEVQVGFQVGVTYKV